MKAEIKLKSFCKKKKKINRYTIPSTKIRKVNLIKILKRYKWSMKEFISLKNEKKLCIPLAQLTCKGLWTKLANHRLKKEDITMDIIEITHIFTHTHTHQPSQYLYANGKITRNSQSTKTFNYEDIENLIR